MGARAMVSLLRRLRRLGFAAGETEAETETEAGAEAEAEAVTAGSGSTSGARASDASTWITPGDCTSPKAAPNASKLAPSASQGPRARRGAGSTARTVSGSTLGVGDGPSIGSDAGTGVGNIARAIIPNGENSTPAAANASE